MDLGSDGVCAAHCCIFLWFLNMIIWPDGSHGAARDFALLVGAMNLKSLWFLMVCVWNLPFGHDKHLDGRYYQLRAATKDFFNVNVPEDSVLWQAFSGYIYNELKALGVEFPGEKPRSIETFEHQKQNPQAKGSKCSFGRFLAVVSTPMDRLRYWNIDIFERINLGLETDALRGGKFKAAISMPSDHSGPGIDVPEEGCPTSSAVSDQAAKAMKNSCHNAIALSVLMLCNMENKRVCECILSHAACLKKWEGQANAKLRSAKECMEWAVDQAAGGWMEHLNMMVANLRNYKTLKARGFVEMMDHGDEHDRLYHMELEYANLLGKSTIVHIGIRQRRGLFYMGGWTHSAAAMLHKDVKIRDAATQRFRRDKLNHEALMAVDNEGRITALFKKRSQFKTVPVQQLGEAMTDTKYKVTPKVKVMLEQKFFGVLQTQLNEEFNGVQKHRGKMKHSNGVWRKASTAFFQCLESGYINEKHRWEPIDMDVPIRGKCTRLPQKAFVPDPDSRSLPFKDIVTYSATLEHHSPAANNLQTNVADHYVLNDVRLTFGAIEGLENIWQNLRCQCTFNMALKYRHRDCFPWKTYIVCARFEDSAVVVWPCSFQKVPGHPNDEMVVIIEK